MKIGVRFTDAYSTAPICNASRVALMTGCYQQRQGVYCYGGLGLHNSKYTTIAEALKQEGYSTGSIGKSHHGTNDTSDKRDFPLRESLKRWQLEVGK